MRKLSELIVLVKGGGEVGSAIAHRLYRSRFRVCISEIADPLAICRGVSFSEAVFNDSQTVEGVTAESTEISLEKIYRVWRKENIPVVIDPECSVKPLIKPDVLVNAMMLNRESGTKITDASLVIGIGPGFVAGGNAHLVIDTGPGKNLGRIIFEGEAQDNTEIPSAISELIDDRVVQAPDSGIFTTTKSIGDTVAAGDVIGALNDLPVQVSVSGILRGLLRNEMKVLANYRLAEIDTANDKQACFTISDKMRAISGGVLEAIMMSLNVPDES